MDITYGSKCRRLGERKWITMTMSEIGSAYSSLHGLGKNLKKSWKKK